MTIVQVLMENLPTLIQGAIQLFMGLVMAIPQICMELAKSNSTNNCSNFSKH